MQYTTLGGTSATNVASVGFEFADVQIFEGDLYVSRRGGTTRGVWVWEDLPTTAGNVETTRLINEGTGWVDRTPGGGYGNFQFFDAKTMFMDHLTGGVHTIEVFRREDTDSREWNLLTGAGQTLTGLTGINHLHALEHDDQVYLFYTSGMGTTDSELWSVAWDSENLVFGTPELLAVADEGYVFGGIVAIPEPSTYALIFGLGVLGTALVVRRRARTC